MITIFNGRQRSVGGASSAIYAQVDVSLRENLYLFNNGQNLNALAVFLAIALHANADGWAWPSFKTLKDETGIGQRKTLRCALRHLVDVRIDGKRIVHIWRRVVNNEQRGYAFHIFPEAGGAPPSSLDGTLYPWDPDIETDDEGGGGDEAPHLGSFKHPTGGGDEAPPKYNHIEEEPDKHSAPRAAGSERPDWDGVAPQVVNVPQGGNTARRAEFSERCDMCQEALSQTVDFCAECGRPVQWVGSALADARARARAGKLADAKAKERREMVETTSASAAYLLQLASATAPGGSANYAGDELRQMEAYGAAYGFACIKNLVEECKAEGDAGRGLIRHVLNKLATQSFSDEKRPRERTMRSLQVSAGPED